MPVQKPEKTPPAFTAKNLAKYRHIKHAFFTRKGGVSSPPYDSLNLSHGTEDPVDNIERNKALAMQYFNQPVTNLIRVRQIHSAISYRVTKSNLREARQNPFPEADAIVTDLPDIVLGIVTADCLPVLMIDAKKNIIAAIHAGWRGALSGVLESAVNAMQTLGAQKNDIQTAIGPAIGRNSYEVNQEYKSFFLKSSSENSFFFKETSSGKKFQFDLKAYAAHRLKAMDLQAPEILNYDTQALPELFFSHRYANKHQQKRGLQLTAISRLSEPVSSL